MAAGVTQTGLFQGDGPKPSKQKVQDELRDALHIYKRNKINLVIVEVRFYSNIDIKITILHPLVFP